MSDVRELRRSLPGVILEHSKKPKLRTLETRQPQSGRLNPLCGDHFTIYVDVKDGAIKTIGFQGSGLRISKARLPMMTQVLQRQTETEAEGIFQLGFTTL